MAADDIIRPENPQYKKRASGVRASSREASQGYNTLPSPVAPGSFPSDERLQVITLASRKTEEHQQLDSSWALDNLA